MPGCRTGLGKNWRLRIGKAALHRLVHFTDLHYKGDRDYLQSVVDQMNSLAPDFAYFTANMHDKIFDGDLGDSVRHQSAAVRCAGQSRLPERNVFRAGEKMFYRDGRRVAGG